MPISGPRETTIRRLFAVSMNRCAFPGCTTPIVDPGTGTILAEVCHIHAQSTGGPRFNPAQTDEDRHAIENLVVMCRVHHKVIDENISVYSAENLREIKRHHEDEAMCLGVNPEAPESVIRALMLSATTYESGSVHMDFRQTKFQVGGEGGSFGGGGGHGGVLTIIGISRLPPGANVNLDGQNGKVPGGGGGGGGALAFQGRLSEETDVRNGLDFKLIPRRCSVADRAAQYSWRWLGLLHVTQLPVPNTSQASWHCGVWASRSKHIASCRSSSREPQRNESCRI